MGYSLGLDTRPNLTFLKALVAELIGTMFLIVVGCGSCENWKTGFDLTQVGLAFGLVVMAMVIVVGPISGCHINPAVSVSFLVGGKMSLIPCILYILAQMAGATLGAAVLYYITPANIEALNGLGGNDVANGVGLIQAILIEALMTMMLVMVIYSVAFSTPGPANGLASLIIGLTVTALVLVGIPYTGCSINPARSFGPAIVSGLWGSAHWVFWVGPMAGGVVGGLLSTFVFSVEKKEVDELA